MQAEVGERVQVPGRRHCFRTFVGLQAMRQDKLKFQRVAFSHMSLAVCVTVIPDYGDTALT
jgi:hypothetical protein